MMPKPGNINERGSSFISILLAAALIVFLVAQFLKSSGIQPERGSADLSPMEQAEASNNVQKEKRIELATEQFRIQKGREPDSLQELVDANLLSSADLQ